MALEPGGKLGPHEILAPIGKGSLGEVWKALDMKPRAAFPCGKPCFLAVDTDVFRDLISGLNWKLEKASMSVASLRL